MISVYTNSELIHQICKEAKYNRDNQIHFLTRLCRGEIQLPLSFVAGCNFDRHTITFLTPLCSWVYQFLSEQFEENIQECVKHMSLQKTGFVLR